MFKGQKIIATLLLIAIPVLLAFQNCSPSKPGENEQSSTAQAPHGNGEGYLGKTYTNQASTGECSDGLGVRAQVMMTSAAAGVLIRQNCQNLSSPQNVTATDLGLLPHNPQNAIYSAHLFDDETVAAESEVSTVLCRSSVHSQVITDFVVRLAGAQYKADLKIGFYAAGLTLTQSLDTGESNCSHAIAALNDTYSGSFATGENFRLQTKMLNGRLRGHLDYSLSPARTGADLLSGFVPSSPDPSACETLAGVETCYPLDCYEP